MRFFCILLTILSFGVRAQVTFRIISLPSNTPANPSLFAAGTFNNWNPGDSNYVFSKVGNNYELTIPASSGNGQFKITQGSWATVEGTVTGAQVGNRSFTYSQNLIIDVTVNGWEGKTALTSTALPNVKIVNDSFYIPQLNRYRRVWIYLPNDYTTQPQKRYPVIYMHDGQNMFDVLTSYSGEWGVDETLSAKQTSGDYGCIVVATDHGGATRLDEYSAYRNTRYGGGQGKPYASFIVQTLKPFIDSIYRTKPEREYTAIAGSSMGGLISFYMAVTYPEVFSKAGIFSPSFWFSDSLYTYVDSIPMRDSIKFYFMSGTTESTDMIPDIDRMIKLLKSKGYPDTELKFITHEDGQHSEWFWRREFGDCYDWLFAGLTTGLPMKEGEVKRVTVYPNPAGDSFSVSTEATLVQLINTEGKELRQWRNIKPGVYLNTEALPRGLYIVRVLQHSAVLERKILLR